MTDDIIKIAAGLQPQEILLDADIQDRVRACEFFAIEIGRAHGLETSPIARALWRREQAASTGLGNGVAIPHARIGGLQRPLTLFIRTKHPVEFKAPDGKPVSQFLVIMVPDDGATDEHLQMLALVARLFSDQAFRGQLDRAADTTAVAAIFRSGITQVTRMSS